MLDCCAWGGWRARPAAAISASRPAQGLSVADIGKETGYEAQGNGASVQNPAECGARICDLSRCGNPWGSAMEIAKNASAMRPRPTAAVWIVSALCAAAGLAGCILMLLGVGGHGTSAALKATARLSFLLFWPAYAGSALTALFGTIFQPLKVRAREFGLAFASAHLVHLGLVTWLSYIGGAPPLNSFILFGVAAFWTYLLALLSIDRLQHLVGAKAWPVLRTVGLNYIAFAFAVDFVRYPSHLNAEYVIGYLPFIVFSVGGPMLRLAALAQRAGHRLNNRLRA
jgi:hypothetical protein